MFEYRKLKCRIKEVFDTQRAFADAMGISYTALNQRLNSVIEWKGSEIGEACKLLKIPLAEAHLYFFVQKVRKSEFDSEN